jgi:hypothetical protein
MDQQQIGLELTAISAATAFVNNVSRMGGALPHPNGPTVRVTLAYIDSGKFLGGVNIDVTNLWDLAHVAGYRADNAPRPTTQTTTAQPAIRRTGRTGLYVVGGAK